MSEILGIIIGVLIALLTLTAIIRSFIKAKKGESIDLPAVGVMNDLPSSITGINKHNEIVERSNERAEKKTE